MSDRVKLSSKLEGNEETNGLDAIAGKLVEDPATIRVALVWLDVPQVVVNTDSGAHVPTVRVRRIEPLGDVDDVSAAVRKLAADAHEARTGRTPLPFDVIDYKDETLGTGE